MFELAIFMRQAKHWGRRWIGLALASFFAVVMLGRAAIAVEPDIASGVAAYENGRFVEAIAHWQEAITPNTPDLTRAYLLSNLTAAYQQLAQFQNAQSALTESLAIIQSWPQKDRAYWEVAARVFNTQGQSQWQQGQSQQALDTWQQAQQSYQNARQNPNGDTSGEIITQINQAMALQELGFNAQAVRLLNELIPQVSALDPSLQGLATKELGKALRGVGELSSAQSLLTASIAIAPSTSPDLSKLQLELGHTARALSHRAIALGKLPLARDHAREAITAYTTAAQPAPQTTPQQTDTLRQTQAQLNQLSYLVEIGQIEAARSFWQTISLANLPTGRAVVEANISYAYSLGCLQMPASAACTRQEWQEEIESIAPDVRSNQSLWEPMTALLRDAVNEARALEDPLLESYAVGELGHVYELTEQWAEAKALSERALQLLEGKALPDAAYRWQWQLGRLYWQQAQGASPAESDRFRGQAIAAYEQAIDSLAAVRQNLLLVDPQVQFSFRDNVEPIYREFVEILLNPDEATDAATPNQQSLQLAVQTLDALQLTELENFLGCNLSQLVNLTEADSDPKAVKIYPIILPEQIAIIFEIPNQPLAFRSVKVAQSEVEKTLRSLRKNLTLPGKTPAVITDAKQAYEWLIAPIESALAANSQIETLVFVPDGLLRNIPMGVLYDGDRYLIEKDYALAIAPQLSLFAPRPMPPQLKVLTGGIGLPQTIRGQSFPPIELVKTEIEQIPDALTVASPLLNEDFTKANIERQLAAYQYSAIHWKTHGVFSSTPAETFLVAYQDGITANGLSDLVRSASQEQAEPLELLVLSACATAQGDRRAVLGLAGIAIRAGTRSTLSTLWRADDRANTQLMTDFYQGLDEGLSKAKALQKAQQLLASGSYPAPYYWASYVLVGNWL